MSDSQTFDYEKLDRGALVVSLDFELAWGSRGGPVSNELNDRFAATRSAVDQLLSLFQRYEVSATWAIVGGMMLGGTKRHSLLSDDRYRDIPVGDCRSHPHWYADDVVESIRRCSVVQEIGCQTLTHMGVDDTPQGRQQFDSELGQCVQLFQERGLPRPVSFVFPEHYMHHFDLLAAHGFQCYRSPESGWFERLPTAPLRAALRLLNSRLRRCPIVEWPDRTGEGLVEIPSSYFFAPLQGGGKLISVKDRVGQTIAGLNAAAEQCKVFHLWTHPNSLGKDTARMLSGWETILEHFKKLRRDGRIESRSMGSLADQALSRPNP